MAKKRCFLCGAPIKAMFAHCITKDNYLLCAKDAAQIDPSLHSSNFRISMKISRFVNSHSAQEIEKVLNTSAVTSYKEDPLPYKSKIAKVDEKLDSIADNADQKADELQSVIDHVEKEEQEKLDIVMQQLNDAGVGNLFGTRKEIKALPDIIDIANGEKILYAATAFVETNSVLVICTNKRVLFLDHGLLYGSKATSIPLDMINSVSYSKGLMLGSIAVTNGATTIQIENMQPYPAQKLAETIKQAAAGFKKASAQSTSNNDLSQLRELKQLLDDGIITKEEFDAKKKQILGI